MHVKTAMPLASLVTLLAFVAVAAVSSTRERRSAQAPSIDVAAPARTQTATFALG